MRRNSTWGQRKVQRKFSDMRWHFHWISLSMGWEVYHDLQSNAALVPVQRRLLMQNDDFFWVISHEHVIHPFRSVWTDYIITPTLYCIWSSLVRLYITLQVSQWPTAYCTPLMKKLFAHISRFLLSIKIWNNSMCLFFIGISYCTYYCRTTLAIS